MDLKIRLINPGDEVFAAMNIFPNIPVELKLSRNSEVTQIRLRKEQYKSNANCNDSEHYIYGGNFLNIWKFWMVFIFEMKLIKLDFNIATIFRLYQRSIAILFWGYGVCIVLKLLRFLDINSDGRSIFSQKWSSSMQQVRSYNSIFKTTGILLYCKFLEAS